jgi:hypothetical protein
MHLDDEIENAGYESEESVDNTVFYAREELDRKFADGDLAGLRQDLLNFIGRHAAQIREVAAELPEGIDIHTGLVETARTFVEDQGVLQPARELAQQIQEINKEIWYQGEQAPEATPDRRRISEDWAEKYSGQWRSARMQEISYVFDRSENAILELLKKV